MRHLPARTLTVCLLTTFLVCGTVHAAEYYNKFDKTDERRGEPQEGHALVYVFRPAKIAYAVKTWAFADDDLMMVSKPTAYSFAQVPAGKRLFWTKSENTSAMELEVEAGKTYYFKIKIKIKMGFGKARANLLHIDEAEAQKYFKKCSYVEPSEEGLVWAVEIVANRKSRAINKAAEAE